MDKEQELEWLEAQKIGIGKDLVAVAKQQLDFLAAVDRRRVLYDEGPVLERAIYRYKTCWLPLLAKHTESRVLEGSLVVPLDCEWIWHCHRLNPVQYKKDCQKFYGRILDNQNVESSIYGKSKDQSAEIWAKLYPGEPFDLDYRCPSSDRLAVMDSGSEETITYDLVSAVKRQSSFFFQVSRPSMDDRRFLVGAIARYKGFLHLIKRNQEKSMKLFCVPTYDIDLIWHSHQLQPLSYCKDMIQLLGRVLEHDDTDPDRSKGKKLDTGFSDTTKQWEATFGSRYWRAGAMYRGSMPSPLEGTPHLSTSDTKNDVINGKSHKLVPLQKTMAVEVFLEIVEVKNFTAGQESNLFVSCSKKQPDIFFSGSCTLTILSECGEKQAAGFQCEPTGELVLALMTDSNGSTKTIGTTSIPLQNLMDPNSKLTVEKWYNLKRHSGNFDSNPVSLRVAASFTAPFPAPHEIQMLKPSPISMNTCFFPLLGKVQQVRRWARFVDGNGDDIINLQTRYFKEKEGTGYKISKRNVVGVAKQSRKPQVLAEFTENMWTLKDSNYPLSIEKKTSHGGHTFEFTCDSRIKLFPGKRLEYEPRNCHQIEHDFITVVEFSADHPYGKALALLNTKSSLVKVGEEKFVLPAILLSFILKKEGYTAESLKQNANSVVKTCQHCSQRRSQEFEQGGAYSKPQTAETTLQTKTDNISAKSSGCGSGCGDCGAEVSGNGPARVKSSGCGSGCGSCGAEVSVNGPTGIKSSGCGSGCGDCGAEASGNGPARVKSSGCGSGCGSCGAEVSGNGRTITKSSGCGSGCGSCGAELSGNAPAGVKSSGCGSGCGSCGAEVNGGGPVTTKSSGCGSGCGSCGAEVSGNASATTKSSGCGSGCGSCGAEVSGNASAMTKCSGCGSGCGSCGAEVSGNAPGTTKSSGCGSDCGSEVNGTSGDQGSGCGSGCGSCGAEVGGKNVNLASGYEVAPISA